MKRWCLLLLWSLLLYPVSGYAQVTIQGQIVDKVDKQAIPGAIITLTPTTASQSKQVISHRDGMFSITIEACDSVWLLVRSLGSEPYQKKISAQTSSRHFIQLQPKDVQLKEVVIDAPLIREQGDTLTYASNQFKTADDRSLADLLKRLPGLEVYDNGRIAYQGKPISKFYVEGLDMLQGRYGIVTNNLDLNKVASIQVLERHQPIRMLRGVESPSTAAINIRLQRSSLGAFFATLRLGATLPLGSYSNQVSVMRFGYGQQNLFITKQDNTGRRVGSDLEAHYGIRASSSGLGLSTGVGEPPLNHSSLRRGNDWYSSLNNLVSLDSASTLTLNVHYKQEREDRSEVLRRQIYAAANRTDRFAETSTEELRRGELGASIVYEANRAQSYFSDKLQFSKMRDRRSAFVTQDSESYPLSLSSPSLRLSNQLSWVSPTMQGRYELRWHTDVDKTSQSLTLGLLDQLILEKLQVDKLGRLPQQDIDYTKATTELVFTRHIGNEPLSWQYFGGVDLQAHSLNSKLFLRDQLGLDIASGQNNLRQYQSRVSGGVGLQYQGIPRLELQVKLPLVAEWMRIHDHNSYFLTLLPSLVAKYEFSPRSMLDISMRTKRVQGDLLRETSGYILMNRHQLSQGSGGLRRNYALASSATLSLRYPRRGLFHTIWYSSEYDWRPELERIEYLNGVLVSKVYPLAHTNTSQKIGASSSWHIKDLKLQTRLHTNYNYSQSWSDIGGRLQRVSVGATSLGSGVTWTPHKYFNISYSIQARWILYKFGVQKAGLKSLNHTIRTSLGLGAKFRITGELYGMSYQAEQIHYDVWLLEAKLSYALSKKCELTLEGTNILNLKSLSIQRQIRQELQFSEYPIRPAEFLMSLKIQL